VFAESIKGVVGLLRSFSDGPASGKTLDAKVVLFVDHHAQRVFVIEKERASGFVEREMVRCEATGDEVFALDGADGAVDL